MYHKALVLGNLCSTEIIVHENCREQHSILGEVDDFRVTDIFRLMNTLVSRGVRNSEVLL